MFVLYFKAEVSINVTTLAVPFTSKRYPAFVIVPIIKLPSSVRRIRAVAFVEKDKWLFSLCSIIATPSPSIASWKPSVEVSPVTKFFNANLAWPEPLYIAKVVPEALVGAVVPIPKLPALVNFIVAVLFAYHE